MPHIISLRTAPRAAVGLLHLGHPCKVTSRIQGFNSYNLSSCTYPSGSMSLQYFTPNPFPLGLHSTVIAVPRLEHWKSAVSTSKREGTRAASPGLSDTWPQHLLPQKYQMANLALTQDAHNRRFQPFCDHSWLKRWVPNNTIYTTALHSCVDSYSKSSSSAAL